MSVWVATMPAVYSRTVKLAECVNAWFEATGKKQNAVAKKAGMLPSKISEIVNSKNDDPQFSTVVKLARGFGVSPARFLDGPPRPEEEAGRDAGQRNPVLDQRFAELLNTLDAETPAQDSWRGDVLKAVAALNRALRREDPGESDQRASDTRR